MKVTFVKPLFLCLALFAPAALAWVTETPVELIADADFDGDQRPDLVVLDKQTGAARVAFQAADQTLAWHDAFATGIGEATSLAVGRISSTTYDSLVIAGPGANRINKFDPRELISGNAMAPVSIYPPGVGPNIVAVAGSDLFVTTDQNPATRYAVLGNNATTVSEQGALARPFSSPNSFVANNGKPPWIAGFLRANRVGFADLFQAYDLSSGSLVIEISADSPVTAGEFVAHRFNNSNPLAQILFYEPGANEFLKVQIQQSAADFTLSAPTTFRLRGRLQALQLIPLAQGGRLLALFGDDISNVSSATIYDFDGSNAPREVQTINGNFSSAAMLGNGNLALLARGADGRSASHRVLRVSGNSYAVGPSQALPPVNRFSGSANALLFDAEPFVNSAARPRQLYRHGDWSTSLRLTPTVRVTAQQFLDSSRGLGDPSSRDFGSPLNGVTAGLVNQYLPPISVFSGRNALGTLDGDVRITPPAGHFGEAQRVTITVIGSGVWQRFYRTSPTQNWIPYSDFFYVFSDATVEAYAKRNADGVTTPIARAAYTFNQSISELDSDNDGVPDFVEQTRGLDPLAGADSDHDGFTDLEELARNTNPSSPNSHPSANAALRGAFNRLVSPRPPHPATGADTRPRANVPLRAYNLGGAFLGLASTSAAQGVGTTNPAAFFQDLLPESNTRFIAETTANHYDLNGPIPTRVGRELIGLVPVPPTNTFAVHFTVGGGTLASESAKWIEAASNAVKTAQNPTVAGLLTIENTLVAAAFEAHFARMLVARGSNDASHATLFDFRSGDADRRPITAQELLDLRQYAGPAAPGYSQQSVFEFLDKAVRSDARFSTLRTFARELWRISAAENNDREGTYPLPFDELRKLFAGQPLTASYLASKDLAANLAAARSQAADLLAAIRPRPQVNLTLTVVAPSPGEQQVHLENASRQKVTLWKPDGTSFTFPPNLQLLPGARVQIFGHSDLDASPNELAVEVIQLVLATVPMPSPDDVDGNLLVDSWEELFFGGTGADAFADADRDGFSNLEEMLAATQPDDATGVPPGTPAQLSLPELILQTEGAQLKFQFAWPAHLLHRFQASLQSSPALEGPFAPIQTPPWTPAGNGLHEINVPTGLEPSRFYFLTLKFLE